MPIYQAPTDDMRYLIDELFVDDVNALNGKHDFDRDTIEVILNEFAKYAEQVLVPINVVGDIQGCEYENGVVRTPEGFKEAYQQFVADGWAGLESSAADGGQGAPNFVNTLVHEMLCAANLAFSIYPGLSHGAYNALTKWGEQSLKEVYAEKLAIGEWTGTMCLTEPHCGTDLGLLRTKAMPSDGHHLITGTKIFISAGEHDMADNIIHLVLARLPDAPTGVRGISLFLVPKFIPNSKGEPGERNGVRCASIEHKMGINGSATCVMNFDNAVGYMVGEPHKGMRAMFTMMNNARLAVGLQGLGVADVSYQNAVTYAKERLQSRSLTGTKYPKKSADPIIVQPDVRRMLLNMRTQIEGGRALATWTALKLDGAKLGEDENERQDAEDFVALLIPVVKAYLTDMGSECANLAVQTYGGHGYIKDHGIEQFVRDARIAQIYEGTNGVQAMDLVGRKLSAHFGRYLRPFFHEVADYLEENKSNEALSFAIGPLAKSFGRLQQATILIAQRGLANPDEAGAAATPYLKLFALTALAYLWSKMAQLALDNADSKVHQAKLKCAKYFMAHVLPQTGFYLSTVGAGAKSMMDFAEEDF